MILQYYGFPINPGELNTWLRTQTEGYIPDGLVNWLAISRYTKTHATNGQPALEFRWLPATNTSLINELNNNRPVILVEPNHFVVAKSQLPTSFGINDPGYPNRPTLASYNNLFSRLGSFIPSHTDLSYIMLTTNPQFSLKVFDTNNTEIVGNTFVQEPLMDDLNNSSLSGQPVKFFMFPKPTNGIYNVEIAGVGNYDLNSYLYDINGNVALSKMQGITENTQTDNFKINIGTNNIISANITINTILEDLNTANSQGKIKNSRLYHQLKLILEIAKELINRKNIKLAKLTLNTANLFLKASTPKFIDTQTSQILQSEIQTLINSI